MLNAIDIAVEKDGCCIISEGTLRPQDLIPKFLDALHEIHPEEYVQVTFCSPFGCPPGHAQEDDSAEWWTDDAPWVLESLTEALDEAAPFGYYFGTHEGDGACFGFFPVLEESCPDS